MQIHALEEDGDVLVFLSGQDDIENLCSFLRKKNDELAAMGVPEVPPAPVFFVGRSA